MEKQLANYLYCEGNIGGEPFGTITSIFSLMQYRLLHKPTKYKYIFQKEK